MGIDANRYGTYQSTRLPREKKTIPLSGNLEDDGKFYQCWNCRFINHVNRAQIGVGSGASLTTYVDTDGVTKYKSVTSSGCAFCGSKNYR